MLASVGGSSLGQSIPDATPLEIARLRLRFMGEMPFRTNLAMQLELPRGGGVTVDVYDIQGRRIRSLHDGALPAGPHAIRWDGNLATGRPAASGVYFVQARADDRAESKRVVLVR